MPRLRVLIVSLVLLGPALTACGSDSPWPASTIPTATPLPDGYRLVLPPTPNTSSSPTRDAAGASQPKPPSH
ncbi:MAG TPA: hypothetical protein VGE42_05495 [Candidatus Dormibacteraeota bacterium]